MRLNRRTDVCLCVLRDMQLARILDHLSNRSRFLSRHSFLYLCALPGSMRELVERSGVRYQRTWYWHLEWRRGVVVDQRSCSTPGPVTTWMGDCLLTGKPAVSTNHLAQLSLPSLGGRSIEYRPVYLGLT